MAYGKEIVTYKNQIASTILNDNEIVSMITEIIPPEKPVEDCYIHIFSRLIIFLMLSKKSVVISAMK